MINYHDIFFSIGQLVEASFSDSIATLNVTEKTTHDYVTNIDLTIQSDVTEFLKEKFPAHNVVGEESVSDELKFDKPTWIIDPLDGTSNFIFGVPFFGFAIALIKAGKVEASMVLDLCHKEVFTAVKGKGASLNGEPICVSSNHSDFIGVSSGFIEAMAINNPSSLVSLRKEGKFRLLGSQAIHLCYVACGRFKAAVNFEAKVWDDAAGALILKEAGGSYLSPIFDIERCDAIDTRLSTRSLAIAKPDDLFVELVNGKN